MFAFQQISYYPSEPFEPSWNFETVPVAYVGGLGTLGGPVIGVISYIILHEVLELKEEAGLFPAMIFLLSTVNSIKEQAYV